MEMGGIIMQTQEDIMAQIATMRDGIAARIKDLSTKWASNTVALGVEFRKARDTFPLQGIHRPGWREWLSTETGWSARHALKFVSIAEKFDGVEVRHLSHTVLDYLSRDKIPEGARQEIVTRAQEGETVGRSRAKAIVEKHLPTPAQAMKEARTTGKLIHARDGHIYSGATEDEMMAHSQRRHVIYKMKDNIVEIAECPLTPNQWIKSIGDNDHWISEFKVRNIDVAIKFLTALRPLLEKRQEEVDGA
jgi:hypothetical protein